MHDAKEIVNELKIEDSLYEESSSSIPPSIESQTDENNVTYDIYNASRTNPKKGSHNQTFKDSDNTRPTANDKSKISANLKQSTMNNFSTPNSSNLESQNSSAGTIQQ